MNRMFTMIALLGMALAGTPLFGDQSVAPEDAPAQPGAMNYVEGNVQLDGKQLTTNSIGSVSMDAGQVLTTHDGNAEILLTPGVFLRVGRHSAVKMISAAITPTEVEVDRGLAAIEVDEIYKENHLLVTAGGVTTRITKTGYYEFDASQPSVKVFKGQAEVDEGDGRYRKVKGSHELALVQDATAKPVKFDVDEAEDALFQWSKLRSRYLAEANQQIAGEYAGVAGFAPGWYWDPYGVGYTFIGADPFFSPFGWGFYPPWWGGFYGGYGGYWGGGYGYYRGPIGYRGRTAMRGHVVDHGPGVGRMGGGFQRGGGVRAGGGFQGGGFRGGGGFGGGGFHGGGGGGFHGGGGGGFHGGGGGGRR